LIGCFFVDIGRLFQINGRPHPIVFLKTKAKVLGIVKACLKGYFHDGKIMCIQQLPRPFQAHFLNKFNRGQPQNGFQFVGENGTPQVKGFRKLRDGQLGVVHVGLHKVHHFLDKHFIGRCNVRQARLKG